VGLAVRGKSTSAGYFAPPQLRVGGLRVTERPSIAGAIHDLQARLGSIRIAVTAVAGLELDEQTRNDMLTSASDESVRASAEVAGIGALAELSINPTAAAARDIGAALREAADTATLAGIEVTVDAPDAFGRASGERLAAVFGALMRIVCGAGKQIGVVATSDQSHVTVRIERRGADADTGTLPAIAGYLVDAIGATRVDDDDQVLAFGFEAAS